MELKQRFEWLLRMALLVFVLAAAAFLSAITTIRLAIHGREVTMPELVGKNADEAQAILSGQGLGMKIADRVYSNLAANQVTRQSPPAGTRVRVGQRAHVVLSLGPREVKVPQLEGKSLRAAQIELLRAGLQAGETSMASLVGYPADTVLQQVPRVGGRAASPRVNLLVAQSPPEPAYVMPYLVGLSQSEAQRQLAAAGLQFTKITFLAAPEWPPGSVVEQSPSHGARVVPGAPVELKVAQ